MIPIESPGESPDESQNEIPLEIIDYITSFNSLLRVPFSKQNKEYLYKRRNKYATLIQTWYKKYKIAKSKPVLFISKLSENKIPKWHLIRIYMKFYPKEDLYDVPYYILKQQIANEMDYQNKIHLINTLYTWNTNRIKAYDVFGFLKTQSLLDIRNGGW